MRFFFQCLALLTLFLLLPHPAHAAPPRIVPRAEWNALEARPYRAQTPKRFTIHHSAVSFDRDRDAAQHIANIQRWGMGEARNWADIPYHFIIAPDGLIYEGRDPRIEGESNTSYDTSGHLQINLLGNFDEQDPTAEQIESLVQLIAWAHTEFDIPTDTIRAHRDFAATACPGEALYRYVADGLLRAKADKRIAATAKKTKSESGRP
jgi:hypothetical protein